MNGCINKSTQISGAVQHCIAAGGFGGKQNLGAVEFDLGTAR